MRKKTRRINEETGNCPICGSFDYSRQNLDVQENNKLEFKCICNDCDNEFKEVFKLIEQVYKLTGIDAAVDEIRTLSAHDKLEREKKARGEEYNKIIDVID